jgi:hypothetical protein
VIGSDKWLVKCQKKGSSMPNFTATGTNKFDFWQVDGSIDFGHIPANIQFDGSGDPIRLHIGNVHFGAEHIMKHETKWPQHLREKLPAELVFLKLNTPGAIWTAEVDHKKKLMLSLRPSALMVLEHISTKMVGFKSITGQSRPCIHSQVVLMVNRLVDTAQQKNSLQQTQRMTLRPFKN